MDVVDVAFDCRHVVILVEVNVLCSFVDPVCPQNSVTLSLLTY